MNKFIVSEEQIIEAVRDAVHKTVCKFFEDDFQEEPMDDKDELFFMELFIAKEIEIP